MRNTSVNVHFLRSATVHAGRQNIDISHLLAKSNISPQLIHMEDARVSARQFADFQTLVMMALDDEFVGYTPHPVPMGAWQAMCHWLISTRNLDQLLRRLCRFYAILDKGFRPRLETRGNSAILHVAPLSRPEQYGLYGYELFLFACHRLLCWMSRERVPIHRVHIPFPRPDHHREYRYLFYSYPVYFEQEECTISFHRSVLNLPVRQSMESLIQLMRHPLYEIIVQDYDHSSWSAQVMNTINRDPATHDSLPAVAKALGTNTHTLRRRLADEGQTFIDLKREVKRDLAIHYLSGTGLTVEQVAFQTGFSEASAFIRAFKQWTGVTPYTYRKRS